MRTLLSPLLAIAVLSTGVGSASQATRIDPERLLAERFQFSAKDLGEVRAARPVVKVTADETELALIGSIRLPGKKDRLSDWIKNIEHFRGSAELGVAKPIATPPAVSAFSGVTLDASDLSEMQHCATERCAIKLSPETLARLQRDVQWGSANAAGQANDIFRQMLLGYTKAYLQSGNGNPLAARAATLTAIAPELANFLERYPKATLPNADQLFYWSISPASSTQIVSLHHLTVYKPRPDETWIADRNFYASRYFDAGALVVGLYDAPDGTGFYAVAGSRVRSSQLGGVAGTVLRRQIQRSAADSVKIYLEWMRDSLAAAL
jgi:hypothetical protein